MASIIATIQPTNQVGASNCPWRVGNITARPFTNPIHAIHDENKPRTANHPRRPPSLKVLTTELDIIWRKLHSIVVLFSNGLVSCLVVTGNTLFPNRNNQKSVQSAATVGATVAGNNGRFARSCRSLHRLDFKSDITAICLNQPCETP